MGARPGSPIALRGCPREEPPAGASRSHNSPESIITRRLMRRKLPEQMKGCGRFCTSCLQECLKPRKPVCGVCRSGLTPGTRALELEKLIESTEATCRGCDKKVYLSKMRAHVASCSKYQNYMMEGIKAATKDQLHETRDVPNRFTFPCPYCLEKNFDQDGLVEHCKKYHSLDSRHVVCPICASMPWGDPNYRSGNFMEHIRRRHKFSYDTFVDYSVDEDAMMNDALMRSLMDK